MSWNAHAFTSNLERGLGAGLMNIARAARAEAERDHSGPEAVRAMGLALRRERTARHAAEARLATTEQELLGVYAALEAAQTTLRRRPAAY
jgi:hypothetical protein